jgi:hypothetical protein
MSFMFQNDCGACYIKGLTALSFGHRHRAMLFELTRTVLEATPPLMLKDWRIQHTPDHGSQIELVISKFEPSDSVLCYF